MRSAGYVARVEEVRNAHRILVGKPNGNDCPSKERRGVILNVILKRNSVWDEDWIRLAEDRDQSRAVVDTALNLMNHTRRVISCPLLQMLVSQEELLSINLEAVKLVSNVVVTLTPANVVLVVWQLFFFSSCRRGHFKQFDTKTVSAVGKGGYER